MARKNRTVRTLEKDREAFLQALTETASVIGACRASGIARRTAYDWRKADAAFSVAWDAALERGTDALEDEAIRRAHQGTEKPIYQGGKLVGTVREYSDTLLIFMLKARRPDRFKERSEHKVDLTSHSEPVSDTEAWLREVLGGEASSKAKKPLPH